MSADDADTAARNAAARIRLTPTERLHEVTMAAMTRAASPPEHSVEVTRNAKGVWQYALTVRGHDLDALIQQAQHNVEKLERLYPYPEANGGSE